MLKFWTLFAVIILAAPVSAQVLDEKAARKVLFSTRGHSIQLSQNLSKTDASMVKAIIPLMAKQLRQPVRYYAAISYSPDDGLVHESIQAAMNYHSPVAAAAAANSACNKLKSKGAKPCALAARIVPKKYKPRPLTISIDATAAFNKSYRKKMGSKAFAISGHTGSWGIGPSDAAAIAACEKRGSPGDCQIVIRN